MKQGIILAGCIAAPSSKALFAFCASILLIGSADAQLLQFNTTGNLGTETTEPSIFNDPGVLPSALTLGSGITPAANGNRFGGSAFFDSGDTNPTTLAESIAGNDFFQFTLTPAPEFQVDVTSFSFIFGRSGTGPSAVALRSSLDNFATDLGQATGLVDSTTAFTNIPISGISGVTSAITFRLFGFGATAATGTGGFDTTTAATTSNVVLNGLAAPVPEPSAALAILSGAGVLLGLRRRRAASI